MLNKLLAFVRQYDMLQPGDRVVCAVSGGADSVALLFAMYLMSQKLQIQVEAAHFNHQLRGDESNRDELFVREFCDGYHIPLHLGVGDITPGEKGLEAAARDARYAFLRSIPGKIATAHTADDNAETLLMHLVRGTGLKGLGGITPVCGNLIRPMLSVTRDDVLAFLDEYHLPWIEDSSNSTDAFLRNRIRHHIMPLLKSENPALAENLSATAIRLREEDAALTSMVPKELPDVSELLKLHPGIRARALSDFLFKCGISEPESKHITALEKLLLSAKPSASVDLPGGIVICRNYNRLEIRESFEPIKLQKISCPGAVELPYPSVRIAVSPAEKPYMTVDRFTVSVRGDLYLRSRQPGDKITLKGGTKDLKKLYIDRKIPAHLRSSIPVLADSEGVVGVYGFGANLSRITGGSSLVEICFEEI